MNPGTMSFQRDGKILCIEGVYGISEAELREVFFRYGGGSFDLNMDPGQGYAEITYRFAKDAIKAEFNQEAITAALSMRVVGPCYAQPRMAGAYVPLDYEMNSSQMMRGLTISARGDGTRSFAVPSSMNPVRYETELLVPEDEEILRHQAFLSFMNRDVPANTEMAFGKCNGEGCQKETSYSCTRCGAFYCSEPCQKRDWPMHKATCNSRMPPLNYAGRRNIPEVDLTPPREEPRSFSPRQQTWHSGDRAVNGIDNRAGNQHFQRDEEYEMPRRFDRGQNDRTAGNKREKPENDRSSRPYRRNDCGDNASGDRSARPFRRNDNGENFSGERSSRPYRQDSEDNSTRQSSGDTHGNRYSKKDNSDDWRQRSDRSSSERNSGGPKYDRSRYDENGPRQKQDRPSHERAFANKSQAFKGDAGRDKTLQNHDSSAAKAPVPHAAASDNEETSAVVPTSTGNDASLGVTPASPPVTTEAASPAPAVQEPAPAAPAPAAPAPAAPAPASPALVIQQIPPRVAKDMKAVDIPSGSKVVISVGKETFLFVRPIDCQNLSTFDRIAQRLASHCANAPPLGRDPKKKEFVAAKFKLDGNYYRALVEERLNRAGRNAFTVRFVDFGNRDNVVSDDMKALPDDIAEVVPFMALKVVLKGMLEKPFNDDAAQLLQTCIAAAQPLTIEFDQNDPLLVTLKGDDGVTINDKINRLLDPSHGVPPTPSPALASTPAETPAPAAAAVVAAALPPAAAPTLAPAPASAAAGAQHFKIDCLEVVPIPTSGDVDLVITYVLDEGIIMAFPLEGSELALMEQLSLDMLNYGTTNLEPYEPEMSSLCVAKWEADQLWYRAASIDRDGEDFRVMFLDYGNMEKVPPSNLRCFRQEFMTPKALVSMCQLKGVALDQAKITKIRSELAARNSQWVVKAKVVSTEEDGSLYVLDIPEVTEMLIRA